ncbi:MAG: tyrosine-type recombinase/integrase [Halobacteriaceae archaeon]
MNGTSEDPIEYFLEDMTFHGKTERTRQAYERVLREFESSLDSTSIEEATQRECLAWVHSLREQHSESTVATYAAYLHRFYSYMTQAGRFDANPMTLIMEELDESIEKDPTRRDISIEQMQTFCASISHPLDRAIILTLLKTGIRVGELCNLDLRDIKLVNIDTEQEFGVRPRGVLDGHKDALYVDNSISQGETVNGERRTAANKRNRETIIPIDRELKITLVTWLQIRPDSPSPADPLLVSTRDSWGQRLHPESVRGVVRRHARSMGWYSDGGNSAENVTPHYFRHFFTTYLRDRIGDRGVVKYLRGDVADDVIDTYTHNWGDRVRELYIENIYLLIK